MNFSQITHDVAELTHQVIDRQTIKFDYVETDLKGQREFGHHAAPTPLPTTSDLTVPLLGQKF